MSKPVSMEERFEEVDWKVKDSIIKSFPFYVQEKFRTARAKNVSNTVFIEDFTLNTPYGDRVLFDRTLLHLEPNKRTCLFGGNGSGKTSLFVAITQGKIKKFPTHLHTYHCKELEHLGDKAESVIDTVMHSYEYLNVLNACEAKLLALNEKEPCDEYGEMLSFIDIQIRGLNGRTARKRCSDTLRVLGFDDAGQNLSTNDLSGGLRMRVALAMAFFINPDLLLLDEPTNHLDFPSVLWLENRLRGYRGSFLLVTHDRDLLENVCTGVICLEHQKMKYYNMSFKAFEKQKGKEDKKTEEDIDKFLIRHRNVDPSTMLGREKADKKQWQQQYLQRMVQMQGKFTFPESTKLEGKADADGNVSLIELKDVRFSYKPEGGVFIFNKPISVHITTGSRLGIMGPNGAGKSTLLKLMTGKLNATSGTITTNPDFTLAYFGQHSTAELDLELTPSEFMQREFPDSKCGILKNHLAKTGVVGDVSQTRMKNLSYSQRSCVIFSKLTFVCPHLLIMDEPTNFLDLASVDSLIAACNKYKGALLVVTHSRNFLRKCAKRFLSVVPGKFDIFDSMKKAEQSTYTFIQELEAGGSAKLGASALAAGGGSMASNTSQLSAEKAAELKKKQELKVVKSGGIIVISADAPSKMPTKAQLAAKEAKAASKGAAVKTVSAKAMKARAEQAARKAAEAAIVYKKGDICEALWTDSKWYKAEVIRVNSMGISVTYLGFGNTKLLQRRKIRAFDPDRKPEGRKVQAAGKGGGRNQRQGGGRNQRQGQGGRNQRNKNNRAGGNRYQEGGQRRGGQRGGGQRGGVQRNGGGAGGQGQRRQRNNSQSGA